MDAGEERARRVGMGNDALGRLREERTPGKEPCQRGRRRGRRNGRGRMKSGTNGARMRGSGGARGREGKPRGKEKADREMEKGMGVTETGNEREGHVRKR